MQSEQVALNKTMSSFSSMSLSPPSVEAAGVAAAGRTAAAAVLAFPSPCLHPQSPTLDQVSLRPVSPSQCCSAISEFHVFFVFGGMPLPFPCSKHCLKQCFCPDKNTFDYEKEQISAVYIPQKSVFRPSETVISCSLVCLACVK